MSKRQARKKPPPRKSLLRRLLGALPALLVIGLVAWVAVFYLVAPDFPDTDELLQNARQARVTVIASDGSILADRGSAGPEYVRLDEISPYVEAAVLATEDRRFYSHFGLDLLGLARAIWANISAGGVVAGGSTITQQLAKNLYLTPERSFQRKLQELVLALWLEARMEKQQILEVYLNRVYLGAGAYGMQAAAQRYFAKNAADLDLAEAAMLAGLLKAPSRYAPTNDLELARARSITVLHGMVDAGMLSKEDAEAAAARPAELSNRGRGELGGHFVDWILDGLTEHLGKPTGDWVVRTTLDPRLQRVAERVVAQRLADRPAIQAAVVLLDIHGAVRAMVGGRSYRGDPFNRAAGGRRQPGSAFKPFVYLTALEQGVAPDQRVIDRPIEVDGWSPRNSGGGYSGEVSIEQAFARSLNTVAVRLGEQAGRDRVAARARQLGISSELREVASLALGTSEVTPLELTGAYLPFATGGIRRPPFAVERVTDAGADLLFEHVASEVSVIDRQPLEDMRRLLAAVVDRGTGQVARLADRRAYGKTGTTSGNRDAWFVGFAGAYIAGVWVGRDDNEPVRGVSGANLPAQIWHEIMASTPRDAPEAPKPMPRPGSKLEEVDVVGEITKQGLGMLFDWIERKVEEAVQ